MMTESEALSRMVAPGTPRPGKWRGGVIQIHVTRACDKACFACTQGSNLGGKTSFITVEQFKQAVESLRGYFGVVGVFGGNPATHPQFGDLCRVLVESWVPKEQRGIWCNNPITPEKASLMRHTFNPAVSNLNVHLDEAAYRLFKKGWPECNPFGLDKDSRHSPPYVAMKDVLRTTCDNCAGNMGYYDRPNGERYLSDPEDGTEWRKCEECDGTGKVYDESRAWELISNCDINQHWSAMIGVFRGELRAWFCEIAGAQAMLHQDDPDYPDTGLNPTRDKPFAWWKLSMRFFEEQVRKHCHECGVPLRGHGALAQGSEQQHEQVSMTHANVYKPKRKGRVIELVTVEEQLGPRLAKMTDYLGNAKR